MLSIGEFSKISKVTTKTLRYYDEIGLLKPARVSGASGYRYYGVGQLKTILLITRLKGYCFSLEEIAEVLHDPGDSQLLSSLLHQKQAVIRQQIQQYQLVLTQMDHDAANLERGIDMMSYLDAIPVKLVEFEPRNILSIRQKMNVNEYGKYMGRLYEAIGREKLTPLGPPLSIYHEPEFNPESYDIEVAVPVREVVTGTRDFDPGLCATATLSGSYEGLPATYAKLKAWMEAEGYAGTGAGFEIYVTDPHSTPTEENITEVYFPVRKG